MNSASARALTSALTVRRYKPIPDTLSGSYNRATTFYQNNGLAERIGRQSGSESGFVRVSEKKSISACGGFGAALLEDQSPLRRQAHFTEVAPQACAEAGDGPAAAAHAVFQIRRLRAQAWAAGWAGAATPLRMFSKVASMSCLPWSPLLL